MLLAILGISFSFYKTVPLILYLYGKQVCNLYILLQCDLLCCAALYDWEFPVLFASKESTNFYYISE